MPPLGFSGRAAVVCSPHHAGRLREELGQLRGGYAGGAGSHTAGQASRTRRPDLAAQDGSAWILRIMFQNILQAPPTHTRNLLRAAP